MEPEGIDVILMGFHGEKKISEYFIQTVFGTLQGKKITGENGAINLISWNWIHNMYP